jgi:hypothetical protein
MSEEVNKRQISSSESEELLNGVERSKASCLNIIQREDLHNKNHTMINGQINRVGFQVSPSTEHLRADLISNSRNFSSLDPIIYTNNYEYMEKLQE